MIQDDGTWDWHVVEGTRLLRARSAIQSREWRVGVITLAIVQEPLRVLTRFFMHCSTTTHRYCSVPHLCDVATAQTTPVVVVSQYLSARLSQPGGRLLLVFKPLGRSDLEGFIKDDIGLALRFRRAVLLAASETYKRHGQPFPVGH